MVTREEAAHALVGQPFAFEVRGGLLTVHTSASVKGEQWKQRWQQCMRDVQRGELRARAPPFAPATAARLSLLARWRLRRATRAPLLARKLVLALALRAPRSGRCARCSRAAGTPALRCRTALWREENPTKRNCVSLVDRYR